MKYPSARVARKQSVRNLTAVGKNSQSFFQAFLWFVSFWPKFSTFKQEFAKRSSKGMLQRPFFTMPASQGNNSLSMTQAFLGLFVRQWTSIQPCGWRRHSQLVLSDWFLVTPSFFLFLERERERTENDVWEKLWILLLLLKRCHQALVRIW